MLNENWIIVGALIYFFGSWPYLRDTIKGIVKPNKVSWILWALAPLIGSYAQFKQGVGILSLTTFILGFVPLIIFIVSFLNKGAEWKITKFDMLCGFLSLVGLVLWQITKVGNIAIFFGIIADGLAAIPTIIKSYKEPETENDTLYWCAVIDSLIGILTIKIWRFEYWGFPVYLFVIDLIIAGLVRFKIGKKLS